MLTLVRVELERELAIVLKELSLVDRVEHALLRLPLDAQRGKGRAHCVLEDLLRSLRTDARAPEWTTADSA